MEQHKIAHNIDVVARTEDVKIQENVSFQSMFLSEKVFEGLSSCGFQKPSPIQLQAIPLGRCGFDLIVKSKSGTGKTVVFSVVALEMIDTAADDLQVLILAPTREIAVQIADVISSVGKSIKDLKVGVFIGGSPEKEDIEKARTCHIAVGAPGRIKSLIKQNILKTNSVKLFVLDEADKLMEKQFQNDINEIYTSLPLRKQVIALSATYPDDLKEFLSNYMQSPTHVSAELESPLLLGLKQFVKQVKHSMNVAQEMKFKNEELLKLLSCISFTQCLIFSNYQTRAESISLMLNNHEWNSTFISAAQPQKKRLEALNALKDFKCRVLLSTDLTARGIDAANVDLIINYDIPVDVMTYLHRMGRAGRYGSKGLCISLVSGNKDLNQMKKFLGCIGGVNFTIPKLPEVENKNLDLWQMDSKEFEQISADLEVGNETQNIKNELLSMKKKTKLNVVNKNTNEALENLSSLDINETSQIPVETTNDPKSLLQMMAEGSLNFASLEEKKRKRNADSPDNNCYDILKSLAGKEFDFSKISSEETQKSDNKEQTFIKNRALFEVAKILTKQTNEIDSNVEENIDSYLNSLNSIDNIEKKTENLPIREENLDNIFLHAYKFTIEEKCHWKHFIPERELEKISQNDQNESVEDEEDEENEDYSEESFEDDDFDNTPGINYDENGKRIYAYEEIPNRMVWVPVENSVLDVKNEQRINLLDEFNTESCSNENSNLELVKDDSQSIVRRNFNTNDTVAFNQMDTNSLRQFNSEHFSECFRQCSDELWQNGLSFNTVAEFDNWFYHWQQSVQNVSDYVRQNLYIREMSNYQNNVKKFKR